MKYIIDIPTELAEATARYWNETTDMTLVPYTEPDRKTIEDEVWEFVNDAFWSMTQEDIDECYDGWFPKSYQEAKAKYEAWKKQKDKIRVGDEVKDHEDIKAVVLDICMDGEVYTVYTENRICEDWLKDEGFVKTGRHFPEVAELLKKMREEEQ